MAAIVVLALPTSGCTDTDATPRPTATSEVELVGPDGFADALREEERVVLNVHTPDEGSIPGTDLRIAFDELESRADQLPADRNTPLAVYCRSGSMSATAVVELSGMGFDDLVELRGGMDAWTSSGRRLVGAV
jgi:rhodanese-related sulfurtransferase